MACGPTEAAFVDGYAETLCERAETCEVMDLFADDFEECQGIVETASLTIGAQDACVYDPQAAQRCLDTTEELACDALATDLLDGVCGEVWGDACPVADTLFD